MEGDQRALTTVNASNRILKGNAWNGNDRAGSDWSGNVWIRNEYTRSGSHKLESLASPNHRNSLQLEPGSDR
jgi:hypothetical protein